MVSETGLQFASALFYAGGTLLLIPGTALFLPRFSSQVDLFKLGVALLVAATTQLLFAAISDESLLFRMKLRARSALQVQKPETVDLIVTHAYFVGGLLFTLGSIAFWPSFGENVGLAGNWLYRFGSCSYLLGSFTSIHKMGRPEAANDTWSIRRVPLQWLIPLTMYIVGAILYLAGGCLFLHAFGPRPEAAAYCWIVGSVFFFAAAFICLVNNVSSWRAKRSGGVVQVLIEADRC